MSLTSQILSDVDGVFLNTNDFAETATQNPQGNSVSAVSVVGVFTELEPEKSIQFGEEVVRKSTFEVSSEVTLHLKDSWIIRGEDWQTSVLPAADYGMVKVQLHRRDKVSTKRTDGGRLL